MFVRVCARVFRLLPFMHVIIFALCVGGRAINRWFLRSLDLRHGWRRYSLRKGTFRSALHHGRSAFHFTPLALERRAVENSFVPNNCNILSVFSVILIFECYTYIELSTIRTIEIVTQAKQMINFLLLIFYPVISYEFRKRKVSSLVMVRNQLPAQVVNRRDWRSVWRRLKLLFSSLFDNWYFTNIRSHKNTASELSCVHFWTSVVFRKKYHWTQSPCIFLLFFFFLSLW